MWGTEFNIRCLRRLSVLLCLRQNLSVNPEFTDVASELAGSARLHFGVRWTRCHVWLFYVMSGV